MNFSFLPPPHTGVALAEKISSLLSTWGIDRKLFSITLDNAAVNDVCSELLKKQLNLKNALVANGNLFHVRCCAHILNLIVREGLKEIDEAVDKTRECVKYVKGSPSRKQKFSDCVKQVGLDSKRSLKQDVPTRWNSTYLMLSSAIYYKHAFSHLELSDSNFKHNPSQNEWGKIERICKFLQLFYDATNAFSGAKYPTANLYFPHVFQIQLKLMHEKNSDDSYIKTIATGMYEKFEKYWTEYNSLLAIAVVFDPRYKMQVVEFAFKKIYGVDGGKTESDKVKNLLFSVYNEYKMELSSNVSTSIGSTSNQQGLAKKDDTLISDVATSSVLLVKKHYFLFNYLVILYKF